MQPYLCYFGWAVINHQNLRSLLMVNHTTRQCVDHDRVPRVARGVLVVGVICTSRLHCRL